ncbi:Ppx/GppA family phosphatase [Altericroceibacterium endophyticum]|uniref:Ppx/GppA family phosphatase n=1 Tax=Altericroceibacterium endophyticum TaxID=1808508 RepID=A0A6I4T9X0_9SPHN|nr:Ppx/GppA family phosphatase [Altericroceibacterium endophyticum]MXO66813.1 Ppx/GppA family phosphatase [Altericroceibacterium endophyticum]
MTKSQRHSTRTRHNAGEWPDRAVIDIGSNTVRMVAYAGSRRAPMVWLNEKVTAKLGRELDVSGRIPDKASDMALTALRRFRTILTDLEIEEVLPVATAAARDAENGPEFLDKVREVGLDVRLLSGSEEAQLSALGVIGAFPKAQGVVCDLGGGSLELVSVDDGETHDGCSLPLGTLRLPVLSEDGPDTFKRKVHKSFQKAGWAAAHPGPLYMVGGTWRAFATYAMHKLDTPLTDPHGFTLSVDDASKLAKKLTRSDADMLSDIDGISSTRAAALPNAAAMLRIMLNELEPDRLVFSGWGLREGLLYRDLAPAVKSQDPLQAGVTQFARPRGGSATRAAMIAAWSIDVANGTQGGERLRLAVTMLALALAQTEPNLRLTMAREWTLHKRWLGVNDWQRGMMCAALLAACGETNVPEDLTTLCPAERLKEAVSWGLAIRLSRRLGAGSRSSMLSTSLALQDDCLTLRFDENRATLDGDTVRKDLKNLANWMGLDHKVVIGDKV